MRHFPNKVSVIVILAFVVGGCQTTVVPPTTDVSEPATQFMVVSSPSPTSPPPTMSPIDTVTPEPIREVVIPSPMPFPLKTNFAKACQEEYYEGSTKISPNGEWLAESCFSGEIMQVSNEDGTKMFIVESTDYFSDPNNPNLMGSVVPVHWTNDNHFIYFTVTPEQWNDGAFLALDSFTPLLCRMNIENGEISDVLSGRFYHSFSPTDRRLIEVQEFEHPVKVVIHDLKDGSSQTLIPDNNPKYGQAVQVVWSPDGLKFVFVAAFGGEYGDEVSEPNIQSLILVDVEDLSQRMIISETPDFIEPISWNEDNIIVYTVMNYADRGQITTYTYDYQSQEISVLPTTRP